MKVLGNLRPNDCVELAIEDLGGAGDPLGGASRTIAGEVKIIDCKNGKVTLGFNGPDELRFRLKPPPDPTSAESA